MNALFRRLFVFELANNHQGSIDHGLAIIRAMADIRRRLGIHAAVKFQFRDLDSFIHPDFRSRTDVKHIPRFMETRLPEEGFRTLAAEVRKAGMPVVVTPFDEVSVARCVAAAVDVIKIASCSLDDWPLIEAVVATGKPVIASTGGGSLREIDNLATFLKHRRAEFALLHCVGLYPTPPEQVQMGFLTRLAHRFPGVPVGYSGHESPENLEVVSAAVHHGAEILERHVGIPTGSTPLNAYSLTPEQTEQWVLAAIRASEIDGSASGFDKVVSNEERDSLLTLKRGVYAFRPIRQGEAIARPDVFFAMPCGRGQTTSGEFGRLRAVFTASRDYDAGAPIGEVAAPDSALEIRSIIHQAKGILSEAHVVLAEDDEIEFSHHHGLDRFREVGALIVNVVNRSYCKKLIVMLPGQSHPTHRHLEKEETFQLIWGDLDLTLNGAARSMKPGQKELIERGTWHSFQTAGGAIVEEMSTTHRIGDSYYEDPAISRLDIVQRKTVVTGW